MIQVSQVTTAEGYQGGGNGLATLKPDGEPPECRMRRADRVQDFVQQLINAATKRDKVFALVDGLVDGNPPYNPKTLRDAGTKGRCNANWGTGRAYWESAAGSFYDLSAEAPGTVEISTSFGNDETRVVYSREISRQADVAFAQNKSWDHYRQFSLSEMVLHGYGPMFWDNAQACFPRAIASRQLLIPDETPSDVDRWEIAAIPFNYYPPELYKFIIDEKAAAIIGWNPDFVKLVIQHAMDQKTASPRNQDWTWYQNELKQNAYDYFNNMKVCKLAHVFWREFPKRGEYNGRITHAIVERQPSTSTPIDFLFLDVGRYENFYQAINPIYFDCGREGLHHTTTGLGVKMFSACEYENRMLCNLFDKASAPKVVFRPSTAEAATKFQLATFSDWGLVPPGTEVMQMPIQGFLSDGLAMYRTSSDLMRSNLSQYRQQVQPDKPGNPDTATEVRANAVAQSALGNTTFAKHYIQLDLLYAEIVRRLCNLNSSDPCAKDFQSRCKKAGVPKECFGRIESVSAVRVVGQGSPFIRQSVTQSLLAIVSRLPETGQQNLIDDFIASHAGQAAVGRYTTSRKAASTIEGDQHERAANQVANAKVGMMPTFSPSQNPLIFATTFLQAASQSLESLQQGGNPVEVVQFLNTIGPGIALHIQRMSGDPTRAAIAMNLGKQAERIGAIADQLKAKIAEQAKAQQDQQQKTQQALSDAQLSQLETQSKIRDRDAKTQAGIKDKQQKSQQDMAIKDATAASQIEIQRAKTLHEIQMGRLEGLANTPNAEADNNPAPARSRYKITQV